jgi:hypothetical protein
MRSLPLYFLLVIVMVCSSYYYTTEIAMCRVPLSYSIVGLDERFNLSEEEASAIVAEAEAVWEDAVGRELFTPISGETTDLEIDFIFDDRQERALAEESLRENLDQKEATSEELQAAYDKLLAEYKAKDAAYQTRVVKYDTRLATFNERVAKYSAEGEVAPQVFAELEVEENRLTRVADELERERVALNELVTKVNALGTEGNRIIQQYNQGVETYTDTFGETDAFTQGDYSSEGKINIYQFDDREELIMVLAHEFGHALDIDHVEGTESIMYYLMEDQPSPPQLGEADKEAFLAVCGHNSGFSAWWRNLVY